VVLVLAVLPAGADETAQEVFDRGVAHYQAGEVDQAAAAFERAYELDPKPVILFSWAQSEVGRDHCAEAIELFRRYLATSPPEANEQAAQQRIRTCEERLAAAPPTESGDAGAVAPDAAAEPTAPPTAAPPPAAPTSPPPASSAAPAPPPDSSPAVGPATPTEPEAEDADRWWTDPLGMTLLSAGVVAAGVGTGVLVWGEKSLAKAKDQLLATYDEHDQILSAGRQRRVAGGIVLGVGLALLTGGVVRAALVDGAADSAPAGGSGPSATLWLSPLSPEVGVVGRF
jgi:tetratricopeptide (TPR) repeat protein